MVLTAVECFKKSNILLETKSRSGKSPMDYKLETPEGAIRGRTNRFKLRVPEILEIAERIEAGENLANIQEDYSDIISKTSLNETMKKYYAGLLDRVIHQYKNGGKIE